MGPRAPWGSSRGRASRAHRGVRRSCGTYRAITAWSRPVECGWRSAGAVRRWCDAACGSHRRPGARLRRMTRSPSAPPRTRPRRSPEREELRKHDEGRLPKPATGCARRLPLPSRLSRSRRQSRSISVCLSTSLHRALVGVEERKPVSEAQHAAVLRRLSARFQRLWLPVSVTLSAARKAASVRPVERSG